MFESRDKFYFAAFPAAGLFHCNHVTAGDDYQTVNTDITQSLYTLREVPSTPWFAISDS